MSDINRYAVFGGIYNNYLALTAVLDDAERRGAQETYCLGDLGGFGPHPDRVFSILQERGVMVMQGNYDHSIGNDLEDCGCGYSDPRDNHYAALSYAYTRAKTSARWRPYLRGLPSVLRRRWDQQRVLMAHGSPRKVNEFLWESSSSDRFLSRLLDEHEADILLVTHSGIPWQRQVERNRLVVNVGAIGRPANDGRTEVWYALVTVTGGRARAELIPVAYDHLRLASEMRAEGIPEEFAITIETGWWTTCLEILPAKERARGRY